MIELLFVLVSAEHIIVIGKAQQISGKVLHGRKLLIARQHIITRTHLPVRMDIGKRVKEHLRILGWLFICHNAHRAFSHFSVFQNPQAKYQPWDGKILIFCVPVDDVCPKLGVPDYIVALSNAHGNVQTMIRQESTFQKIIAGVASADSVVQFQRINLSIADNTAGFMLLHNKGVA